MFTKELFKNGIRDGVPIGLGYFAVSFSLGIACSAAGLNAFQGALMSLLNNASAGEYAAVSVMAARGAYLEIIFVTLVANARYLLMSCALSSRCGEDLALHHRLLLGFYITDELFGITIARPGKVNPFYTYGAIIPATSLWALGTAAGIIAGNILPLRIVSALSVALYGMFIAIIVPPAKENKAVLITILASFSLSILCDRIDLFSGISSGTVTIILTVIIASLAAVLAPVKEDEDAA